MPQPQESNADDPAPGQPAVEGEDQNTLFAWANDQPIADDSEAQDTGPEADEPANDDPQTQQKDSGPEASREPAEGEEDEFAAEEDQPQQPEGPEGDIPDSEKKRFEYWQSQHDKVKNELREYKQKFGNTPQEVVELAQNIVQKPELLDAVEGALTNNNAQTARAPSEGSQEQAKGSLEKPSKPQKPSGYDHYEALNDPESESYRYLEAMQEYEEQLSDFLVEKEQRREQEIKQQRQQAAQQQKQRQARQQMAQSLKTGYGMDSSEVDEFFEVVGETPELDDLVKYYRAKTGKASQQRKVEKRKEQLKSRKERKKSPPPAGSGASAAKPPQSGGEEGPFVRK